MVRQGRLAVLLLVAGCGPGGSSPSDGGAFDLAPAADLAGPDLAPSPYPHLAILPATHGFQPADGGAYTLESGFESRTIGQAFYAAGHPDVYDFLIVFSDFTVSGISAFTDVLKIDIAGIGLDTVSLFYYGKGLGTDDTAEAGSAGHLQAICFLNGPGYYRQGAFFGPLDIVTHEVGHRWGAYLNLPMEPDPWILLERSRTHWAMIAGLGGPSAMGYHHTVDNGDGTFTAKLVAPMPYSPWDLHAMGLVAPADLPPLFFLRNQSGHVPALDPLGQPWNDDSTPSVAGVTFRGDRVDLTAAQVAAQLGPRTPPHDQAQKSFRHAFVVLCPPGKPCSKATLDWVEQLRNAWPARFDWNTGGRATVDTTL